MAATVTIDKIYFETLLRKANVHGSEPGQNYNARLNTIPVTKEHYDKLANSAKEYIGPWSVLLETLIYRPDPQVADGAGIHIEALRTALIRGGVTVENLELLINAGIEEDRQASDTFNGTQNGHMNMQLILTPSHDEASRSNHSPTPLGRPPLPSSTPSFRTLPDQHTNYSQTRSNGNGYAYYEDVGDDGERSDGTTKQDIQGPRDEGNEYNDQTGGNRTLFFTRLPEKATYASFLEVVRGGVVVDAWMKPSDRCASISFLHPQSAETFYRYAKKNDLYVDGRRIVVEWREPARQFVVLPNILRQIHSGATRNLYLKNIPSTLSEERLRNDLDHIANLSIEKIIFEKSKNAVQVNLNSVCVACFARTCLKSRAYYRGTKIDFGTDDCAKSLPDFKAYKPKPETKIKAEKKVSNRFDALAIEEEEDGEEGGGWVGNDTEGTESWADSVTDGTEYPNCY